LINHFRGKLAISTIELLVKWTRIIAHAAKWEKLKVTSPNHHTQFWDTKAYNYYFNFGGICGFCDLVAFLF